MKLLIAEDEKDSLNLMSDILKPYFKEIISATDGASALLLFKKYNPDFVLCDVLMPRMNGLDLAKQIRQINNNTKIIVISAYSDRDKLLNAINININKYLIKPIIPEELIKTINSLKPNVISEIIIANNVLNTQNATITINGKIIQLSQKELIFLEYLSQKKVLNTTQIKQLCWINSEVSDGSVRIFIKRLRDKLGIELIKNVKYLGYKLVEN
ncbi:response regulator transcription factor [Campylobacter canadensis]|uniref:Response regulator transcription factor n=1 Tax=Campylobacter canadensis TaxID=449520 RepID=A0ABS7WUY0_9BACT|nr:response regulator transcription factor [Campylobacter canadensis]MBZ7988137.1 response regulator transcription factor [Campylobacter canadensis]MBZ7995551.1 response regulator transcription factor [Campylobacter canadensis]MBZ7997371.1 response regulator transcription factor [Campylobacter canadensis]MBZ7999114.1 response regulator transcription factor [Campylobacter canadensis]MBZ8000931.1 response regulator transcription factor [Campylobacter canadensis]